MLVQRDASHRVQEALARQAAVGIFGPRQVGKTLMITVKPNQ